MCESDLSAPFKMQSKKWANIIQNYIQNRGRTENGIATLGCIGRAWYISCFVDRPLRYIVCECGDPTLSSLWVSGVPSIVCNGDMMNFEMYSRWPA